jgi:hypothetical protein
MYFNYISHWRTLRQYSWVESYFSAYVFDIITLHDSQNELQNVSHKKTQLKKSYYAAQNTLSKV